MEAKKIGPRSKSTLCVSSNPAATPAAVATLVRETGEFLEANPDATLDVRVSGAAGGALATELQKIGKVTKVTTVPGANATTSLDAVVVARSKAGVALEQVRSTTCIVPTVQNLSEYDVAVQKASVVITINGVKVTIVKSKISAPQGWSPYGPLSGATGVWLSRTAYAVQRDGSPHWAGLSFKEDKTGAYGFLSSEPDLALINVQTSDSAYPEPTPFTWTGNLPPADYFDDDES